MQRVYYGGQYATYPKHIDEFFADKGLDVPDDVANKVNFFGNKCWCGSKFFYIESDGQIRRCYTHQSNSKTYELGSLDDVDGITVLPGPIPCLSDDKISPCVCFKHFQRQAFLSDIKAEDAEIEFWNKYMRENPEPEGENTPHAEEKAPEQAKRGIIPSLGGKIFKSKRK